MHTTTDGLLTSKEVAERLDVDRSTVSRLVSAGRLTPAVRGSGIRGEMFFATAAVERIRAEREAAAPAGANA